MPPPLARHLGKLAGGYARRRALLSLAVGVDVLVGLVVWFALADPWLRFSQGVCWGHWAAGVAALCVGLVLAVLRLRKPPSPERAALLAEKRLGCSNNSLINAVQLAKNGKQRLSEALLDDIPADVWTLRGARLASPKALGRALRVLAALALVLFGLIAWRPATGTRALARLALPMAGLPPLTDTRIVSIRPGDTAVARGESLTIHTRMAGRLPSTVTVETRSVGNDATKTHTAWRAAGEPPADAAEFSATLEGLTSSLRYRVRAGDADSRWYSATVQHPPDLRKWRLRATPPHYTGLSPFSLSDEADTPSVPQGSTVAFEATATCELRSAVVTGEAPPEPVRANVTGTRLNASFTASVPPPALRLVSSAGLATERPLPFRVDKDSPPSLQLVDTPLRQNAPGSRHSVPVTFRARDEFGVSRVGIERLHGDGGTEAVTTAAPPARQTEFAGRFLLELATFAPEPGEELRFRVWAEDNGPAPASRRALSPVLAVRIPSPEQTDDNEAAARSAQDSLAQIIDLQKRTLAGTRHLQERAQLTARCDTERLLELRTSQRGVRRHTVDLLETAPPLGDLVGVLHSLCEHEMREALVDFERVRRQPDAEKSTALLAVVSVQETILASLTGVSERVPAETRYQKRVDLFAALQALVEGERAVLEDIRGLGAGGDNGNAGKLLAKRQDALAQDYLAFEDLCNEEMNTPGEDTFAKQVRRAYDGLREGRVYEQMLGAAEALDFGEVEKAAPRARDALEKLLTALDILNSWRAENARDRLAEAVDAIRETTAALTEMEKKQAQIAEVTRDITKRGMDDPEVREKLDEMDAEQEEMKDLIEELAQDLYQFPELPVCNELNSKMRELFEDVQQALDSENAPSGEIAVQKEDSFLDAIRDTKERAEDLEMWLPDTPDTVAWNMESFDADEFPDMPLVPLPDELEDLVGGLLEQSEQAEQDAQDATGNNMMADGVMGWDVMDGPIPNFSAKGKSGNTKPNDNEMTGRSGAGREGQSTGELVENHVKGLEGRETNPRRTRDPLQKGQVTEDEESTLDARSTGGGKLGGQSESQGMFGDSPRRDLHTPAHGDDRKALRQETEALYAKARMLYLKTGKLGLAARDLRSVEDGIPDIQSFESIPQKVLRRLSDSRAEIAANAALPLPAESAALGGGADVQDVDLSDVDAEYRHLIGDYYRSLSE